MVINMSELFGADGISGEYEFELGFSEIAWQGESYPVSGAKPVRLKLVHEGNRRVSVSGEAVFHLTIPCDRCLEPVDVPFSLVLDREVDAGATPQERIAQLDEQSYIDGYLLDTDRLILDELIINMPVKVLCKEDCRGVCPVCGANRNRQSCGCSEQERDPRMAAILDLFQGSED